MVFKFKVTINVLVIVSSCFILNTYVMSMREYHICHSFSAGGRGPRVVVSTAAFHARVRGLVLGLGGLKETKNVSSPSTCESQYCRGLRDREVACSASDRQGSDFKFCVWRTVSSQSSHHPQEVLLAQFSLYVHKGSLKPDSFHFSVRESWSTSEARVQRRQIVMSKGGPRAELNGKLKIDN